jgi:hypothetical protein
VSKTVLKIVEVSDECKKYYLGDLLIMNANHDDHGWSGMEAIDTVARSMANGCDIRVVELQEDEMLDPEDTLEALKEVLQSVVTTESDQVVLEAATLLADSDITPEMITDHIALATELCGKHNLEATYHLLVSDVVGEFVGVTINVLASTSMDMTYQLNHELAQLELERDTKQSIPIFDVVFSRKH